jgi:D-alanine-D-alanine ligase
MKIAVIAGGASVEAEVSRASAAGVSAALRLAGHVVTTLELDRALAASLLSGQFDVAFPVAHGALGEDGSLQGLLEVLDLAYVGSNVLASAAAMSKPLAKLVFASVGLPVARGIAIARGDATSAAARARAELGGGVVVKPAGGGSAIGVTRIEPGMPDEAVAAALTEVWQLDAVALVEDFARGREITCSVLDTGDGPRALAATEIISRKDAFYNYSAKYGPGRSEHLCPAPLGKALTRTVHDLAVRAHVALGCRDLSRADFVVGDGDNAGAIILLEVNTLPGFTPTSLFPEAALAAGISVPELCDQLARAAFARGATPRNAPRALPTE